MAVQKTTLSNRAIIVSATVEFFIKMLFTVWDMPYLLRPSSHAIQGALEKFWPEAMPGMFILIC